MNKSTRSTSSLKSRFGITASIMLAILLLCSFMAPADTQKITVFMIGDSTMANKPTAKGNPERGWGQLLQEYLIEDYSVVDNHAVNGRSSKSFIDEGRWDAVLERIKPGDYVFIQFGHNDEKPQPERHTDPGTTFDDNLRRFVLETRERGGIPVLFNSIVRRNFGTPSAEVSNAVNQDDAFYTNPDAVRVYGSDTPATTPDMVLIDTHGAYLDSPRNVAYELDVPFIDMNSITHSVVEAMGPEQSKKLFVWVAPGQVEALPSGREDNTHLNVEGARVFAGLTMLAVADAIPALAPYTIDRYDALQKVMQNLFK